MREERRHVRSARQPVGDMVGETEMRPRRGPVGVGCLRRGARGAEAEAAIPGWSLQGFDLLRGRVQRFHGSW